MDERNKERRTKARRGIVAAKDALVSYEGPERELAKEAVMMLTHVIRTINTLAMYAGDVEEVHELEHAQCQ